MFFLISLVTIGGWRGACWWRHVNNCNHFLFHFRFLGSMYFAWKKNSGGVVLLQSVPFFQPITSMCEGPGEPLPLDIDVIPDVIRNVLFLLSWWSVC